MLLQTNKYKTNPTRPPAQARKPSDRIPQSNIFGFLRHPSRQTAASPYLQDATVPPRSFDFASPEPAERRKPLRCKTLRTTKHPRFCVSLLHNPNISRFCVTEKPFSTTYDLQPPSI